MTVAAHLRLKPHLLSAFRAGLFPRSQGEKEASGGADEPKETRSVFSGVPSPCKSGGRQEKHQAKQETSAEPVGGIWSCHAKGPIGRSSGRGRRRNHLLDRQVAGRADLARGGNPVRAERDIVLILAPRTGPHRGRHTYSQVVGRTRIVRRLRVPFGVWKRNPFSLGGSWSFLPRSKRFRGTGPPTRSARRFGRIG